MSEEEERNLVIRRILVALDDSAHSRAALQAAAKLAARFDAELLGVFVEDTNLFRAAQSPIAREIGLFSATRRRMSLQEIERQLRVQAHRVQRAFSRALERQKIEGSFRVARGAIIAQLLDAAYEADILILGKAGGSPVRRRQVGSTTRAAVMEAPKLTLILRNGTRLEPPLLVLHDGSTLSQKGLFIAAALAEKEGGPMTVLALAEEPEDAIGLRKKVAEQLGSLRVPVYLHAITISRESKLIHTLQLQRYGTLVVPAISDLWGTETLIKLLNEAEAPVLLVR